MPKLTAPLALALALCQLASCARLKTKVGAKVEVSTGLHAQVGSMVGEMLAKHHISPRHIARKMHKRMTLKDALPRLQGKLPQDVMSLVSMATSHKEQSGEDKRGFSDDSLDKARVFLNGMMYDAWLSLDQIEVECKEFEESNREVFEQITTDLDHLGSQFAEMNRLKAEAQGGIADAIASLRRVKTTLTSVKRSFVSLREKNTIELSLRQDDQDVFDAILQLTSCPNGEDDDSYSLSQWEVCEDGASVQLNVNDADLQTKVNRSPRAQNALMAVLAQSAASSQQQRHAAARRAHDAEVDEQGGGGQDQGGDQIGDEGGDQGGPDQSDQADQAGAPSLLQTAQKPPGSRSPRVCHRPETVNCGVIHDTMAMEWGKFKDLVDELTEMMERNHDDYVRTKENLNEQIATQRSTQDKFQQMLSESVSEINSLEAAKRLKEEEKRDVTKAYETKMAQCKERMTEILYTNICAVKVIRNTLMVYSSDSKPHQIKDCDVSDWVAGPCTLDGGATAPAVECDDGCPKDVGGIDVDVCGGVKSLHRSIITPSNDLGMQCPPAFFESKNGTKGMKCNQFRCPVACVLSQWSGWSECSKECGGGTQGKTRSILTKNKNGGQECDTTMEEQPCNTGSCNQDCELSPWNDWGFCSQACSGGWQTRVRKVDVPIKGSGRCPGESHPERKQWRSCNTQECQGDEICIAKQDLIVAIDSSGSLTSDGFELVKNFAYNLTSKYQSEYYGVKDMQIGLVVFGNGEYFENGTVAAAIEDTQLTDDLDSVRSRISELTWQRGFTNVLQALSAAETMFEDGRDDAQAAVLLISDGKFTEAYRTGQKAQALKDKGTAIMIAPIAETWTQDLKVLQSWASEPLWSNYERVPGFEALKGNEEEFAQRLLVKFCPRAFSPSLEKKHDEEAGFLKIHENGYPSDSCGVWKHLGHADTPETCMQMVRDKYNGDTLGFAHEEGGWWHGTCYSEAMDVTQEMWDNALNDRLDITCPGGAWVYNYYASTYIMNPSVFGNGDDSSESSS